MTEEFCLNFENNTKTPEYTDIEAEVASFNFIISVTEHTVPILLSFYIGSWSDCFGRSSLLTYISYKTLRGKELGGDKSQRPKGFMVKVGKLDSQK